MSDISTSPVSATPVNTAALNTLANTPSSTGGKGGASGSVSNMKDLKEKAPEVYKAMMQGIAQTIISKMHTQQEHLKKMMRDGQRDASG
jgi:hypothetical protein